MSKIMRIRDILTFDNYIFVYDQINDDMLSNKWVPNTGDRKINLCLSTAFPLSFFR